MYRTERKVVKNPNNVNTLLWTVSGLLEHLRMERASNIIYGFHFPIQVPVILQGLQEQYQRLISWVHMLKWYGFLSVPRHKAPTTLDHGDLKSEV